MSSSALSAYSPNLEPGVRPTIQIPEEAQMAKSIALIGCGNIGSRTLQSILSIAPASVGGLDIWCVDPSSESLDMARARAVEALGKDQVDGISVQLSNDMNSVPSSLDLAIISTTSTHRFQTLNTLLDHAKVENLVLEKFLFTEEAQYYEVSTRLVTSATRAWVNCPRPAWPGYVDLTERLSGGGPVQARISGSAWAMASNSIHFLAMLSALSGERLEHFDSSGLDSTPFENKRGGFKEVTGLLRVTGSEGMQVELVCLREGRNSPVVDIISDSGHFIIFEGEGRMLFQSKESDWKWQETRFEILFASQMKQTFSDILLHSQCRLPRYEDMVIPHLELMKGFNEVFFGSNSLDRPCPVT
jgi:hypothetical protein